MYWATLERAHFTKYYYSSQIKKDQIGGTCRTHGDGKDAEGEFDKVDGEGHFGALDVEVG